MDAATRQYIRSQIDRKIREHENVYRPVEDRFVETLSNVPTAEEKKEMPKYKDARVPCAPFVAFLERYRDARGLTDHALADVVGPMIGVDPRRIYALVRGGQKEMMMDTADLIVSKIDVFAWWNDPDLKAIYESFDWSIYNPGEIERRKRERNREHCRAYQKKVAEQKAAARQERFEERVRMKDIAKACGVSVTAVSFVMNDNPGVSEEMRDKVKATAKKMGYAL